MADRYYIWEDEEQHGPYTERQIERMLEDRVINFSHQCEHAKTGKRVPLDELFELEDEEHLEDDGEEWEEDEEGEDDGQWEEEDGEEDGEEDEDWDEEEEELPPNAVLYSGHPTILRYVGALALIVAGIAFGLWLGPRSLWFFIGGFGVASITAIAVAIDRSTRIYAVTPRRIELEWGLIAKSSNEVRIEDIRTINVRKRGLLGMLGVGTVEFSSTGDSIDVTFTDVWAAHRIKALVREIQDEMQ